MLVGHRLPFKTFDVYEVAVILVGGITLAAHTTGAMLVQRFKIIINDLLSGSLPAGWYRKRHDA